jgi:hypothetical protein
MPGFREVRYIEDYPEEPLVTPRAKAPRVSGQCEMPEPNCGDGEMVTQRNWVDM